MPLATSIRITNAVSRPTPTPRCATSHGLPRVPQDEGTKEIERIARIALALQPSITGTGATPLERQRRVDDESGAEIGDQLNMTGSTQCRYDVEQSQHAVPTAMVSQLTETEVQRWRRLSRRACRARKRR